MLTYPDANKGWSRRALLAALPVLSCGRRHGSGFAGYAFIANELSRAVAAVDLTTFSLVRQMPLGAAPGAVAAHPSEPRAWVLAPAEGMVSEIDARRLEVVRRAHLSGPALGMRLGAGGGNLWILQPAALISIPLDTFRPALRIRLPHAAADYDISRQGDFAAVTFQEGTRAGMADLAAGKLELFETGMTPGIVRFQFDGRQLIAGGRGEPRLALFHCATLRKTVELPLPVAPRNFCFNYDGGQLFLTGDGMDAVTIVYPYSTEVDQTLLAGRTPGEMAVARNRSGAEYLLVANRESGDVTVIAVSTRKVVASVPVGKSPGPIAMTPDDQYALVLNRQSGDLAVIRIEAVTQASHRRFPAPIFTMVPVGSRPVAAAVVRL